MASIPLRSAIAPSRATEKRVRHPVREAFVIGTAIRETTRDCLMIREELLPNLSAADKKP